MTTDFNLINLYQCAPAFRTPERTFDYHYMLYVHGGKGWFWIDGQKYETRSGDLYFCRKFSSNIIEADAEEPFLLSGIEFRVEDDADLIKYVRKKYNLVDYPFLKVLLNEMIREYSQGKIYAKPICSSLLQSILFQLIRISKTNDDEPAIETKNEMLKYIQDNFNQELSHEKLHQLFYYHKNTINLFLKKATGMTLTNYVIELRMKHACELLTYSTLPISEISQKCGYHYETFFSRQFNKHFGVSPNEFRAGMKLENKKKSDLRVDKSGD